MENSFVSKPRKEKFLMVNWNEKAVKMITTHQGSPLFEKMILHGWEVSGTIRGMNVSISPFIS